MESDPDPAPDPDRNQEKGVAAMTVARHDFFDAAQDAEHVIATPRKSADPSAEHALSGGRRLRCRYLTLQPGGRVPLTGHYHRSLRLVVAQGGALVTIGEDQRFLAEEDSAVIPATTWYEISNPGCLTLHLLMIEIGGYLGEDDVMPAAEEARRAA